MSKFLSFEDILLHFKNLPTYVEPVFQGKMSVINLKRTCKMFWGTTPRKLTQACTKENLKMQQSQFLTNGWSIETHFAVQRCKCIVKRMAKQIWNNMKPFSDSWTPTTRSPWTSSGKLPPRLSESWRRTGWDTGGSTSTNWQTFSSPTPTSTTRRSAGWRRG